MIRRITWFVLPVLVFAIVFVASASIGQTDPKATSSQAAGDKKGSADQSRALLALMHETIDLQELRAPHTFKETLMLLAEAVKAKGKELPLFVDVEAFKEENPEAPDIYDTSIRFPVFPKRMKLVDALRFALRRLPTGNATYLVRGDVVEITTYERASPERLLGKRVSLVFEGTRLRDALQSVSAESGLSVVLDGRVGARADKPVTALFRNDVTVEAALRLLADMAELKLLLVSDVVYITTPTHAKTLMDEEAKRSGAFTPPLPDSPSPPFPNVQPGSPVIPRLVPLYENRRKEAT